MTHKLFHDDVTIREFDAQVLSCKALDDGRYAVVLDRTAFYAEAGGQPCDLGTLGGAQVLDVQEEGEDICHIVDTPLSGTVHGAIDWARRFSNMQQHGGQHLLSWAIYKRFGGYTYGLHIGAQECTIDTDLKQAPSREQLNQLEQDVNELIWRDLPVRQWFPSDEELATLPLRKRPTVSENIRIVMTGDFECVACCGTHPTSSGQIGLIAVLGAHPARGKTRFSFLCGSRAYQRLHDEALACRDAGLLLSATHEDLVEATQRVLDEARERGHEVAVLRQAELMRELPELLNSAQDVQGVRVVAHRFDKAGREALIRAASELIEQPGTVALLMAGSADSAGDIAVFARADDVQGDMGRFMRAALSEYGGRGGGRPNFAQGGAPAQLDAAAILSEYSKFGGQ